MTMGIGLTVVHSVPECTALIKSKLPLSVDYIVGWDPMNIAGYVKTAIPVYN